MKNVLVFCFILLVLSCKNDSVMDADCGGSDPIKNLEWLNKLTVSGNQGCTTIYKSSIDNTKVFGVNTCTCCIALFSETLYKCDGTMYCDDVSSKDCQDALLKARKNAVKIYESLR